MDYIVWVYCQKNDCHVHRGWKAECRVKYITGVMNKWILGEFKWLEMNCLLFHLWEQTEQISLSTNQITSIWQSGPEYWTFCVLLFPSSERGGFLHLYFAGCTWLCKNADRYSSLCCLMSTRSSLSYYYCSRITGSSHLWGLLYSVTCEVSHFHAATVWWCLH